MGPSCIMERSGGTKGALTTFLASSLLYDSVSVTGIVDSMRDEQHRLF